MKTIQVIVRMGTGQELDIEIPLDISAEKLITALHEGLHMPGACPSYIRSENPVSMIYGSTQVVEYGLHRGSILYL